MYICICKAVTDRQIKQAIQEGHVRFRDLQRELGVSTGCGKCAKQVHGILRNSAKPPEATCDFSLHPAPSCG